MKKIIKILFFVIFTTTQAQISVYVSGGKSGLKYNGIAKSKIDFGGNIGVGYTYKFIDSKWSILSGLELGLNRNVFSSRNIKQNKYLVDSKGSSFDYRLKMDSYEEKSSFMSINVPIIFRHTTDLKTPMYFDLGCKIIFPMTQKAEIKAKNVHLNGYYPDFNLLVDELPQNGFGTKEQMTSNRENKMKPVVALTGGLGLIVKDGGESKISIGIYCDYGLMEARKEKPKKVKKENLYIDYSPDGLDKAKLNTSANVFYSRYANIMSYGIQLRYIFGKGEPTSHYKCNSSVSF